MFHFLAPYRYLELYVESVQYTCKVVHLPMQWCVSCFDKELCMEIAVIVFCDQPVGGFVQQFHRKEWPKTCSMEAGIFPTWLYNLIFFN